MGQVLSGKEVRLPRAPLSAVQRKAEDFVAVDDSLRGDVLIPIHWGTLAFHGWTESAERLMAYAPPRGVALVIPRPGQSVVPGKEAVKVARWWPQEPWRSASDGPMIASNLSDDIRPRLELLATEPQCLPVEALACVVGPKPMSPPR